MQEPEKCLIGILLDEKAELGDRDDAAMDLSEYDDANVEGALSIIACDSDPDEVLADSCAESLAEIWSRRGSVSEEIWRTLSPVSRPIAFSTIKALNPSLAKTIQRLEDD